LYLADLHHRGGRAQAIPWADGAMKGRVLFGMHAADVFGSREPESRMLPYGQGGWPFQGRTKRRVSHEICAYGIVKYPRLRISHPGRIGQEAAGSYFTQQRL
jgi:hypothetical protein